MDTSMFRPAALQEDRDPVAQSLLNIARTLLIVVFGLFPLMFIPVAYAPLQYSKVLFVLVGVILALIFYVLAVLREGRLSVSVPLALVAFWGLASAYLISAVLSGDVKDALIGNSFEVHTAAFMLLLAAIATSGMILRGSKTAIVRLYGLLIVSGTVLALFHLVRLLFGADTLSFGVFNELTSTPLGSWNGLALYFGLVVLLALVALEQLPLTAVGKWIVGVSAALALVMLAVVNFYLVWVVIAAVSIIMLIYMLARKHYQRTEPMVSDHANGSLVSVAFTAIVLLLSLLFMLGGSALAGRIAAITDIQYIEVRPSLTATVDIARNVYQESPLFGIGPNRFADAWRMHKDSAINDTIFWNTAFDSGSGLVPTAAVTTGVLGLFAWLAFFGLLLWSGFRMVFNTTYADRFWAFIGQSSFVAAVYLWGLSVLYTPSAAMLMLAAVCTGTFFAAYGVLLPQPERVVSATSRRGMGLLFVGAAVLLMFGSVSVLYTAGRHYAALYSFNRAFAELGEADTIDTLQAKIMEAYELSENDIFVRMIAEYRLAQAGALLSLPEPTENDTATFQRAAADAVSAAETAVRLDPSDALNWSVLGQVYAKLAGIQVAEAYERAKAAFERMRQLDSTNPDALLFLASVEMSAGNTERAVELAEETIRMKRNHTPALLFLSRVDIMNGDVSQAIARTESTVAIEPQNPARHYQLGVLQSSANNTAAAIRSFERAIALDPQYANARYLLALIYAEEGRRNDALAQLAVVAELNPDNQELQSVIARIEAGEPIGTVEDDALEGDGTPVEDGSEIDESSLSETTLVVPVNTVPSESNSAAAAETTVEGE